MTREEQIRKAAHSGNDNVHAEQYPIPGVADMFNGYFATCFELGAKWADQHPQWISVEEKLPEETEVVLGVREGGTDVEMYRFMGFNESANTFDWEWHPYYRAVVDDVTHWMPLPAAPRKEDHDRQVP